MCSTQMTLACATAYRRHWIVAGLQFVLQCKQWSLATSHTFTNGWSLTHYKYMNLVSSIFTFTSDSFGIHHFSRISYLLVVSRSCISRHHVIFYAVYTAERILSSTSGLVQIYSACEIRELLCGGRTAGTISVYSYRATDGLSVQVIVCSYLLSRLVYYCFVFVCFFCISDTWCVVYEAGLILFG